MDFLGFPVIIILNKGQARPKVTFIPSDLWIFMDNVESWTMLDDALQYQTFLKASQILLAVLKSVHSRDLVHLDQFLLVSPTEEMGMLATNQMGGACTKAEEKPRDVHGGMVTS